MTTSSATGTGQGGGISGNDAPVAGYLPYEQHLMGGHGQSARDIDHIMDEVAGGTVRYHADEHASGNADHAHPA